MITGYNAYRLVSYAYVVFVCFSCIAIVLCLLCTHPVSAVNNSCWKTSRDSDESLRYSGVRRLKTGGPERLIPRIGVKAGYYWRLLFLFVCFCSSSLRPSYVYRWNRPSPFHFRSHSDQRARHDRSYEVWFQNILKGLFSALHCQIRFYDCIETHLNWTFSCRMTRPVICFRFCILSYTISVLAWLLLQIQYTAN